jgi:hypothetical protein
MDQAVAMQFDGRNVTQTSCGEHASIAQHKGADGGQEYS